MAAWQGITPVIFSNGSRCLGKGMHSIECSLIQLQMSNISNEKSTHKYVCKNYRMQAWNNQQF